MGLFDWFRRRGADADEAPASVSAQAADAARAQAEADEWEEVPAYLPVDAAEHRAVVVAATVIAAGDRPESKLVVRRVSVANPEHRLVTCIASSIAAGALEKSQFVVKKVYKKKVMEENHAA